MRILLATSERELLNAYQLILTDEYGDVTTAFDGAIAMALIDEQNFDIAILDARLPRVDYKIIAEKLCEKNIPSVVMVYSKIERTDFAKDIPAAEYLSFPFFPEEMKAALNKVWNIRNSDKTVRIGKYEIKENEFKFSGLHITAGEIEVLEALEKGDYLMQEGHSTHMNLLNSKFSKLNSGLKITYDFGKGYKLVNQND